MAEIPPGKGSDWQEREAAVLNPPSMSDRANPRAPGGTFVVPPVDNITTEVPRNSSADHATRDVYNLVLGGGTPQPPAPPPEEGGALKQPAAAAPPADNPWDAMTRHAELDEFATDLDTPDDWTTMTIAAKKEWLDENYVSED